MLYADPVVGSAIHRHALADGKYTGEITNTRKAGTIFEAYLSASVLRDCQGQVLGVMGISRDITAHQQAEAEGQEMLDRKTLWERVDGDANLLRDIVALFLADGPERLVELHEALTHQDCTALARAAHRLKGALGNISANNAVAAVRRVETAAREGDVQAATEALARLEDALARLIPLLTVCAGDGQAAVPSFPLA